MSLDEEDFRRLVERLVEPVARRVRLWRWNSPDGEGHYTMLLGGTSGHLEMVDQQNVNMVHCLRIDSQRSSPKALQSMLL
ncbi:hypothetical protein HOLleu_42533 [Holothuria leucospilota]|uniref:Uncharacterized protein n=1 Tax=Holothuria leucospilota TaxID=206669 RepID=A0A9Q0YI34_HOLLE|nr:hypothetical protein HOLleu_42533 [Holothuria leucospilota]